MSVFSVQINGGPVQTLTTKTGVYELAAVAALALLDYEPQKTQFIKIWADELIDEWGPYVFAYSGGQISYLTDAPQWMIGHMYMNHRLILCPDWLHAAPSAWNSPNPKYLVSL